jgi:mono/diheme cytochrome c family protein
MRITVTLILLFLFSFTATYAQVNNPWEVPEKYTKMENPFEADKSSFSIGKSYYAKHCKTCHGKTGRGDGLTSKTLDVDPSDLTLDDLDTQKDGEVYYKIYEGRGEMPGFKKLIDEEDIWHVVNYVRTFYKD